MKRYASVDRLAERAFELRESLGAACAQDVRMIRGLVCGRCGGGPATPRIVGDRTRPGRWSWSLFCVTCGERWEACAPIEVDVLRGKIQAGRRPGWILSRLEADVDEWLRIERVVFGRPRRWEIRDWRFALEAWRLWLHARLGGYHLVAEYGATADPFEDFRGLWTEARVKSSIEGARLVVLRRASRRPRLIDRRHGTRPWIAAYASV